MRMFSVIYIRFFHLRSLRSFLSSPAACLLRACVCQLVTVRFLR
jgi:hypothetical protein